MVVGARNHGAIAGAIAERARNDGPLSYAEVVELALYHPQLGFYETGGAAGRADACS